MPTLIIFPFLILGLFQFGMYNTVYKSRFRISEEKLEKGIEGERYSNLLE